jgi:secondary thiamine-phosphate synthase enzyme
MLSIEPARAAQCEGGAVRTHQAECVTVTARAPDFVDITDEIEAALARSGIRDGHVTVFSPEETCSILVQERESGLLVDIEQAMDRLGAAPGRDRVALVGSPSVVLPAVGGKLRLGVWQRVLLVELGGGRRRAVTVQIVGE